ncbi:GNAT family N-acetyltransferase [Brevundimonas kwangchunensis]|uniref:GNAT family N-acetyltransferase n=1 Tax=Brevundimonas kwangchunensis TaxID=322163 RepID=A0ABP3RV93_9CAUL
MSDQAPRLAALHATAFDAPWDAAAFADLLAGPGVFVVESEAGFILMRAVADEAEILTLAVRPDARGRGEGGRLTAEGVAEAAERGAHRVFLEVADDNASALAVYRRAGFEEAGRRLRYYARADGSRRDAMLLTLNLTGRLP